MSYIFVCNYYFGNAALQEAVVRGIATTTTTIKSGTLNLTTRDAFPFETVYVGAGGGGGGGEDGSVCCCCKCVCVWGRGGKVRCGRTLKKYVWGRKIK